jgi:pyruvate/2-oxoglutarate dehydrogenase complex dihydrolipoamide acyltransferase (E2) component
VGGIATRPRYTDGVLVRRDILSLTLSFDHAMVDGAVAARFAERFRSLIETGHGLRAP